MLRNVLVYVLTVTEKLNNLWLPMQTLCIPLVREEEHRNVASLDLRLGLVLKTTQGGGKTRLSWIWLWRKKLCYVMSCCHVMSCHVMSCHVMLCYVMLCHVVMSCHVMSCYVMLCYVFMSCYVMLCYVMLCSSGIEVTAVKAWLWQALGGGRGLKGGQQARRRNGTFQAWKRYEGK